MEEGGKLEASCICFDEAHQQMCSIIHVSLLLLPAQMKPEVLWIDPSCRSVRAELFNLILSTYGVHSPQQCTDLLLCWADLWREEAPNRGPLAVQLPGCHRLFWGYTATGA
eukprot:739399-Pelagomonas_calceolata.AAC.2